MPPLLRPVGLIYRGRQLPILIAEVKKYRKIGGLSFAIIKKKVIFVRLKVVVPVGACLLAIDTNRKKQK
ncbi:MAG: hypothetical protein HDS61_04405 [Barnesiella sp.]|nr:hypothetical protein [Barnesiella sp.]